jgi:regulatory protein
LKSAEEFVAGLEIKSGADLGTEVKSAKVFREHSSDLAKQIEARAVYLLAMREHGAKELKQKLLQKFPETSELLSQYSAESGFVNQLVTEVIQLCQTNNWQSDERYLEQTVSSLAEKGQGPLKIQQKLQQACSDCSLISAYLDWDESDWIEIAQGVLEKKYGDYHKPIAQKEQAKRMRFLQSRGFTQSTIWKTFK